MSKSKAKTAEQRLQSKLERLRDFTPHATPELQAAVAEVAGRHGRSLTYWDGMVYGLALSIHANAEWLLKLLELEQEPPELQAEVTGYAAGIWARLDVSEPEQFDISVNPELVGTRELLAEWLRGFAFALQLDPEPLRALTLPMTVQVVGEDVLNSMMLVLSFANMPPERQHTPEWQELQDVQHGALAFLDEEEPDAEGLAQVLQLLLMDVDTFYGFSALLEQFNVNPALLGQGGGAGLEPIRREGRKIRPNEPCPCGSGKKYKKCHGAPGASPLP